MTLIGASLKVSFGCASDVTMQTRTMKPAGTRMLAFRHSAMAAALAMAAFTWLFSAGAVYAQSVTPGAYYWYAPEHEQYGRTAFYSIPSFSSGTVRVTRTQRFKVLGAQKGWVALQFDVAGKAYVHLRILRIAMYNPEASDPFYEFKRASVFSEEPAKVEASIKAPAAPTATPRIPRSRHGSVTRTAGTSNLHARSK